MSHSHDDNISELIHKKSIKVLCPGGRETEALKERLAGQIADSCHCTLARVYREALKIGVSPYRYLRNQDSISISDQLRLAESAVAVVGVGGLGGQVLLLLVRIGIGRLIIVDNDVFDETNLNRQALCTNSSLGKPKVHEAALVAAAINPAVEVSPHQKTLEESNAEEVLCGTDVIVDGLDNIADRFMLEKTAANLDVPLVHGALSGFEGRIMTIMPGDKGLRQLYGKEGEAKAVSVPPEDLLGFPAITPALIATLQATEVIKLILKRGDILRNTMLHVDLYRSGFEQFYF